MKPINAYPHWGGCENCRAARVCNHCGDPLDYGRCTNGRCSRCHASICTPGGDTSEGHGYGTYDGKSHFGDGEA